jgi:hypothetical protein
MEALDSLRIQIKPTLDSLMADHPAYVMEAQSRWKQKAAVMKKQTEPAQ